MTSSTKSAVLALTPLCLKECDHPRWTYIKTGTRFLMSPVEGVQVTLSPNWTFSGWLANSQANVSIQSEQLRKLHKKLLAGPNPRPAILRRYQQIWRSLGETGFSITFVEDAPDPTMNQRLIDQVPTYVSDLITTCEKHVLVDFDFTSERAFLESMPRAYHHNADPFQDPINNVLKELLLGNLNAVDDLKTNPNIPPTMLAAISDQLKIIEASKVKIKPL